MSVQVTAPTSGDGALFVAQSEPASLGTGQVQSISVTYLNSGSTTWTRALHYELGSQNPQDNLTWGVGRVLLASNASIAPGQQVTFTFNVTAPATGGTYNLQWRMLRENVAWFGDLTPNDAVNVVQHVTLCPGVQVVADGITDASAGLQQCIDNTASGGTLQLPAGAYGMGVTANSISCGASHLCDFGMNFGPHAWQSTAPNTLGGTVYGNTVSSAKQGINVDGAGVAASPLELYGNTATGSPASATFNCGVRSTSNLNIFTGGSTVNRNGDTAPATNVAWDDCP